MTKSLEQCLMRSKHPINVRHDNDDGGDDHKRCHCFKGDGRLTLSLILPGLCWSHRTGPPIHEGKGKQQLPGVRVLSAPLHQGPQPCICLLCLPFLVSARRFPCDS